jgi:predicted phage tail protein
VTGLKNGTSYVFRVAAINSVGTGTYSSTSAAVIPQTTPGQPTGLSGDAGNGQASLSWLAPSDNGGRNITTYTVEYSSNGGSTWTEFTHANSSSTSLTVTGLTNGTSYVFRVAAINGAGTGTYSVTSSTVIPQTTPGQPTGLSGNAGNGLAELSWHTPTDNGGRNITTYTVEYSSNDGSTWTEFTHANSTATSLTVTGLTNGTSYVFRVAAINSVGTGTYSDTSAVVIPQAPATVPGQPTDLSSTAGVSGTAVRGTHTTTGTPSASPSAVAQEMVIAPTRPTPAPEALPAPTVSPEDYPLLVSAGAGAVLLLVAVSVALLTTQRRRRLAKRG